MADEHWQDQGRQDHGWFGNGTSLIAGGEPATPEPEFPTSGTATVYPVSLDGRPVKMGGGRLYRSQEYSAALLGFYKGAIPFGTRVLVEHGDRKVGVEVNDYGPGGHGKTNVLDLSRAAARYLIGKSSSDITPIQIGVVRLDHIKIVDANTPLGPN